MESSFPLWVTFAFGSSDTEPGGEEGGWSADDPSPSNPTWRGIEYDEWCQHCGIRAMSFNLFRASATRTAIAAYVLPAYWEKYQVDLLAAGPDVLYADGVFNGGGVANLQATLNAVCGESLECDGVLGPITVAAMRVRLPSVAASALIKAYAAAAERRYRSLAKFSQDGAGWLTRLGRCQTLALKLAGQPAKETTP